MRGRLNDLFMSYWGGSAAAADPKFVNFFFAILPPATYIPRRFFYAFFCLSVSLLLFFSVLCYYFFAVVCRIPDSESAVRTFGTISVLVEFLIPQPQQSNSRNLFFLISLVRCISAFVFSSPEPEPAKSRSINERARANTLNTHALLRISSSTADHRASKQKKRRMRRHKNIKFILFTLAGASRVRAPKAHANFSNGIERRRRRFK